MSDKILITKIKRRPDGKGADLYAKGHKWPDTTLFDLSDLALVGLDYEALQPGVETPCRFWAIVEEGKEKPDSETGAKYLDVVSVEPFDNGQPSPSSDLDGDAILAELKAQRRELAAIRALLQVLVTGQGRATSATIAQADPFTIPEAAPHADEAPPTPDEDASELEQFFGPRPNVSPKTHNRSQVEVRNKPQAGGNGDAAGYVPTSPKALVKHLRDTRHLEVAGAGELFLLLREKVGEFESWPKPGDMAGWEELAVKAGQMEIQS